MTWKFLVFKMLRNEFVQLLPAPLPPLLLLLLLLILLKQLLLLRKKDLHEIIDLVMLIRGLKNATNKLMHHLFKRAPDYYFTNPKEVYWELLTQRWITYRHKSAAWRLRLDKNQSPIQMQGVALHSPLKTLFEDSLRQKPTPYAGTWRRCNCLLEDLISIIASKSNLLRNTRTAVHSLWKNAAWELGTTPYTYSQNFKYTLVSLYAYSQSIKYALLP